MPKQPALSGWVWRNARFLRPLPRKPPLRTFRQLRKVTTPPQPKPRRTALRRPHLDPDQLQSMTVAELKKLAADMGIETKQLKTKDELVEAICAEDVVPGDESTEAPELSAAMPTA